MESGNSLGLPGRAYFDAFVAAYPESPIIRVTDGVGTIGAAPFLNDIDLTGFFNGQYPIPIAVIPGRARELFFQFDDLRLPNIW